MIVNLSDGVTESLINNLSKLPNVRVIARNSVFSYKDQPNDVQKVARQLGVRAVLTGRVLMQGDTLDVRVELTDAQHNTQLWGDHLTRKAGDIFAVPDEIARQVSDALRVSLTSPQQQQVTKRYTENAEAYRLYLQGRYFFNEGSEEGLARAITFFDQAIAKDPRYALAYSARAYTYSQLADLNMPMTEANGKAKLDATTALSMDDQIAEARLVQALVEFGYDWNFAAAETDFKQALALDPNHAEAHHQYMYYLALLGRTAEAGREIKSAQELDPANPSINVDMALPSILARQYDPALSSLRKSVEMFPNFFLPHMALGSTLIETRESNGIQELEKARTLEKSPLVMGHLGYYYAKTGRRDEARKLIEELQVLSKSRYVAAYWLAVIYAGLNEKDQAFTWLEKAYQDRSWWLVWLKTDPKVDGLRSDPRFADLMHRVGLPQ